MGRRRGVIKMEIQTAKYFKNSLGENVGIILVEGGITMSVPLDEDNRHYQAIQEWVDAGNTIAEPD